MTTPEDDQTPPAPPLGFTPPAPPPAPPPPAPAEEKDEPAPPAPPKPQGRKRKVTAKKSSDDDIEDLKATIRQQSEQMTAMMTLIANMGKAEVDTSITPYERERLASHEAQRAARARTPERDADPSVIWVGSHYQARETVHGMVPIEMVETLKPGSPIKLPQTPEQALAALKKQQKTPIQEICDG